MMDVSMIQSESRFTDFPAAPVRNPGRFTLDRVVLVCTLVLVGIATAISGANWWRLTRFEHESKTTIDLYTNRPHLRHDFTLNVTTRSAPTPDTPGTYIVTFTGKFANNGRLPFTLNNPGLSSWLGVPKKSIAEKHKAITFNAPYKETLLKWDAQDRFDVGRPVDGRLLNPGEDIEFRSMFFVTAAQGTFFGLGCHVYLEYPGEPTSSTPYVWDWFRMVELRETEPVVR
jgi:hypothetical protein